VARRQAERFRNLESLDRQESQGATTRVAVSAIAVNGLGLMLLWTLLRSRRRLAVHDDVIWRLEHTVSRMSSTASARLQQGSEQLRDRIESLSDPLGRLPRTGLAALSAASVACILALLITGMVMALGLWMHSLTLRAIFVEIVAGVAAGVWLAGRYALTSTGRAERSAARRAADG